MKQWKIAGLIVLFVVGLFWWQRSKTASLTSQPEQQKPDDQILESDWYLGNRQAEVVVVEYSDLQCPACQFYSKVGRTIVDQFGDRVGFSYRHFPLRQIHRNANLAAQAAEAAGLQGKFWEMEEILFSQQAEWSDNSQAFVNFVGYAKDIGLDTDRFRQDIDSKMVKAEVEADYLSGLVSKVNQTPTFFINGQRINNLKGPEDLVERVKFSLEEATASATISSEPYL